jgi:serine/threonine protein kinase
MSRDFQKVEELYHQALWKPQAEWANFLESACAGDEEICREVKMLLACQEKARKFMDSPAMDVAARMLARSNDRQLAGSQLGPYEILFLLGAGGMGEVYRARDNRLDRTVAIKILPQHLSSSTLRERFEQEGRAVASLNHPHICTLHDIGHQDGVDYLVMEYLEGETLAERLKKGPLPLDQALRYGNQIADALDRAHGQGVVHRDLKPANIMLTKDGAKVLDFGLAKIVPRQASPSDATQTMALTSKGTIQYMAPEQLEGREADARTDFLRSGRCCLRWLLDARRSKARPRPA